MPVKDTSKEANEFSEYVRLLRESKGFSLSKVERQSGGTITGAYVNQIENGQVFAEDISLKKIIGLAKGLQVSTEELINAAIDIQSERENNFMATVTNFLRSSKFWSIDRKRLFLAFLHVCVKGMNDEMYNTYNTRNESMLQYFEHTVSGGNSNIYVDEGVSEEEIIGEKDPFLVKPVVRTVAEERITTVSQKNKKDKENVA